jgi:hypothetical protein
VVWRDGKIDYDIITFDNAEIITDPNDWKKIIGIKYYIGLRMPYYDDKFVHVTQDGKVKDPQVPYDVSQSQWDDYR